jgi:acetoin utilization deacetylase AcuC-like enzyme
MSDSGRGLPPSLVLQPGQERHDTGAHPENARRLQVVEAHLRNCPEWESLRLLEARRAGEADVAEAHSHGHVEAVRAAAYSAPGWIDTDTAVSPESFEVALDAAGGAIVAVEAALGPDGDGPGSAFALVRPPGHHATIEQSMGFCLFNNAAVAARYAQRELGVERVAIVDWDVHHGNGTQDIFFRDPSVLVVSLHQWPLYPGTGWLAEIGAADGSGFTVNLPMPPGSGDREHFEALERAVMPVLDSFDPGVLIVSAGQDGHAADDLSNQMLTATGYHGMASRLAGFAAGRGIGVAALHEGGYNLETLPLLDRAVLAGLGGYRVDLEDPWAERAGSQVGLDTGWQERLDEILTAIRPWWADAL